MPSGPVRETARPATLVVALLALSALLVTGLIASRPSYAADDIDQAAKSAGDQASAALERLTEARAAYDAANLEAREVELRLETSRSELTALDAQLADSEDQFRGYVAALVRGESSSLGQWAPLLVSEDPRDLIEQAGLLDATQRRQNEVMAVLANRQGRAEKLAAEVEALAEDLDDLRASAKASLDEAETAKRDADALAARAQRRVASRDAARQAAASAPASTSSARRGPIAMTELPAGAECSGGSVAGYPNGRIPSSLLCPLWGADGESLRADAAAAFNQLSQAYAADFGGPICVTDSYRSYDEQVSVKRSRGSFAATPGTSNHGWGLAVDLCGGINSFGTSQHNWMRNNAPSFGYFHPSWAQRGGSKPEAWHWEFAG